MRFRRWTLIVAIAGLLAALSTGAVLAAPSSQEDPEAETAEAAAQQHGYLGLALMPVNDSVRERLEIPEDVDGLVVRHVDPEGPAADADVAQGDVVTALNGQPTPDIESARAAFVDLQPGDVVTLTVYRNGASHDVAVTLGEAPDRPHNKPHRRHAPRWISQVQQLMGAYPNLLDGELRLVNGEGEVVTFNVTPGQVVTTAESTLTVEKKDESEATFTLTEDSIVIKKGERVERDALEEGSRVVVVEQDGAVKAVIAGPFRHHRQGPRVNIRRLTPHLYLLRSVSVWRGLRESSGSASRTSQTDCPASGTGLTALSATCGDSTSAWSVWNRAKALTQMVHPRAINRSNAAILKAPATGSPIRGVPVKYRVSFLLPLAIANRATTPSVEAAAQAPRTRRQQLHAPVPGEGTPLADLPIHQLAQLARGGLWPLQGFAVQRTAAP